MPRSGVQKTFFSFVGGLNTDASPMNTPENSAKVLNNVDLDIGGKISRRLGLDFEDGFLLSTETYSSSDLKQDSIALGRWDSVEEDGDTNFFVVRIGNDLRFYDAGKNITSSNLIDVVDISSFAVDALLAPNSKVQFGAGRGVLIVVGEYYNPIKVSYDVSGGTFSAEVINLQIRDFEGLDDGLVVDDRPTTLSDEHNYNLLNQGWRASRITTVAFPSNADVEFLGNTVDSNGDTVFKVSELTAQTLGNTPAPKGHFILDPFAKDRATASGIVGLPNETTDNRPTAVAFFSSRAWYAGVDSDIYFSQTLDEVGKVGNCYQEQDPTAEDLNELLATDGGVIPIPGIGNVLKLVPIDRSILVFASNGVWNISGGETNFTADSFSVDKVTSVGALGANSIVVAEMTYCSSQRQESMQ